MEQDKAVWNETKGITRQRHQRSVTRFPPPGALPGRTDRRQPSLRWNSRPFQGVPPQQVPPVIPSPEDV